MHTRSSPKTPYEIRLELLQLAQTILQSQYDAKAISIPGRSSPSTEEIIVEAEKMNLFISKANHPH